MSRRISLIVSGLACWRSRWEISRRSCRCRGRDSCRRCRRSTRAGCGGIGSGNLSRRSRRSGCRRMAASSCIQHLRGRLPSSKGTVDVIHALRNLEPACKWVSVTPLCDPDCSLEVEVAMFCRRSIRILLTEQGHLAVNRILAGFPTTFLISVVCCICNMIVAVAAITVAVRYCYTSPFLPCGYECFHLVHNRSRTSRCPLSREVRTKLAAVFRRTALPDQDEEVARV